MLQVTEVTPILKKFSTQNELKGKRYEFPAYFYIN